MEFITLVAPGGGLWQAWVAAHWERRLRKDDHLAADVKAAAALALEHVSGISLRCLGHLLVGFCRLLAWKTSHLEKEAQEVQARLQLSSSHGRLALGQVRDRAESAVTLRVGKARVAAEAYLGLADVGDGGALDLLLEPEPLELLPGQGPMEVEACLEEGRRHVAPLALITLNDAPAPALATELLALHGPEDAFGAPSQEERAAMARLSMSSGRRPPLSVEGERQEDDAELPPVDYLLGEGGADALHLESGDVLGALPGAAAIGAEGVASPAAGGAAVQAAGGGSERTPTPQHLVRTLDFDITPAVPDSMGPPAPPVRARAAAPGTGPLARLLELGSPAQAPGLELAVLGEGGAEQPPAKKRRKCRRPWLDEVTEIPQQQYYDTTAITRKPALELGIYLPHQSRQVGLTTVYGDLRPELCELILHAPVVAAKRRRARAEAQEAAAAAAAAAQAAAEASGEAAPSAPPSPAAAAAASAPASPSLLRAGRSPAAVDSPPPPATEDEATAAEPVEEILPGDGMEVDAGRWPPLADVEPTDAEEGDELLAGAAASQLREALDTGDGGSGCADAGVAAEGVSFLDLCAGPPGGAEAAAARFLGLLSLHMEGAVSLDQDEPYGDIIVGRGPTWPAWCEAQKCKNEA